VWDSAAPYAAAAGALFLANLAPGADLALDASVIADPASTGLEKTVATGSFLANAVPVLNKFVPSAGGLIRASRAIKSGVAAKGGTYRLRDRLTGQVRRTGQSNELDRRRNEHARNPATKDLDFEVDKRSDDLAARRGREQTIHDQHPEADLNKRNPISPTNPNRDAYLGAGRGL